MDGALEPPGCSGGWDPCLNSGGVCPGSHSCGGVPAGGPMDGALEPPLLLPPKRESPLLPKMGPLSAVTGGGWVDDDPDW